MYSTEKSIVINSRNLLPKEINSQRVVTFKDVDDLHERPSGTAKRNFNENKEYFIEGEDFYKICADEIRTNKIMDISPKAHQDIVFLTEFGYLLLVKSLTDKLAWQIQRQLVNGYFRVKNNVDSKYQSPEQINVLKQMNDKYQQVLSDNQTIQKSISDLANNVSTIKSDVFKISYKPTYSAWKTMVNAKILEVSKITEIPCTTLQNQIFLQMKENGCDLIKLSNQYAFENGIDHCPIIEYIDKTESIKRQFEVLLDKMIEKTASNPYYQHNRGKTPLSVKESLNRPATAVEIAGVIMQPLIEKFDDHSSGGCATYRKVYVKMGVNWKYRTTVYMKKHELKVAPKKMEMIVNDRKLRVLFTGAIEKLLQEN